ncbi:MAG: hypothetical protein HYS57_01385 [Parcubacteria group bacterium]|nr:hypothetical protein [Parcubacteria group bacterium]
MFDVTKLSWMNAKYIREKPPEDLLEMAKPVWEKVDFGVTKYDETYLLKVLSLSRDRLEKLSDLPFLTEFFFRRPEYNAELLQWRKMAFHELPALVGGALARLSEISEDRWSSEAVAQALEPLLGPDKGKLLWPLRVALSGREASPGPYELAGVLGKTETLARLHHAQNLVDVF